MKVLYARFNAWPQRQLFDLEGIDDVSFLLGLYRHEELEVCRLVGGVLVLRPKSEPYRAKTKRVHVRDWDYCINTDALFFNTDGSDMTLAYNPFTGAPPVWQTFERYGQFRDRILSWWYTNEAKEKR